VSLDEIFGTKYGQVLCYPKYSEYELKGRIKELRHLQVKKLAFMGKKKILNIPVLGKGYVGIVIAAYLKSKKVALKIRRIDAGRRDMFHEGLMLKKANSIRIGPKLFKVSKNFLLMDFIEGNTFPEWMKMIQGKDFEIRVKLLLKKILEQCYELDQFGLDHGEINDASKHIIINSKDTPYFIDFETSSLKRKVSNVTSICQYVFLGNAIASKLEEKIKIIKKTNLIRLLRIYKKDKTRDNFNNILKKIF
jgi:putative serine/threonine protein kinase